MKKIRVLDYLKKYQIPIVVLSLLAGAVFYGYMQRKQTYSASAIINYTNSGAETGMAPDGSQIDVSEIYSSQVMTRVFERMGLDYSQHNLDELRSRVNVSAILTDEDKAVQEAKNAAGEAVTVKPTRYYVTFTAEQTDSSMPEEFARQVLDNMLDVYIQTYGENHINSLTAPNDISDVDQRNYDYLEMVELVEKSVENTLDGIYAKFREDNAFRSSANGYSFTDLYKEFDLLRKTELSDVYAYILNNKVTKDTSALMAKYENRIQNFYLNNNASETEIAAINNVIDSYVRMMRESGNVEITAEYILDEVHKTDYEDAAGIKKNTDQTVEYDILLQDYVDNRKVFEWSLIEVAYCRYIMEIYSGEASVGTVVELEGFEEGEAPGEEGAADGTDTAASETADAAAGQEEAVPGTAVPVAIPVQAVSSQEAIETTEVMISELVAKTNRLYELLMEANEEYNEYGGAANIGLLTNIVVVANQRIMFYATIVVVIFLCVFCAVAVLLGRIGDIVDYYVYRDRKFDLPNRVGCDKFMERYANQLLPENFCCIVIRLMRVKEKNVRFGRETMDDMMLKFNGIIKDVFPENDDCFVALNGVGQYIIYARNMTKEHMDTYLEYLKKEVQDYNELSECRIEYECGSAETGMTGAFRIKLLLMNALHDVKPMITL